MAWLSRLVTYQLFSDFMGSLPGVANLSLRGLSDIVTRLPSGLPVAWWLNEFAATLLRSLVDNELGEFAQRATSGSVGLRSV